MHNIIGKAKREHKGKGTGPPIRTEPLRNCITWGVGGGERIADMFHLVRKLFGKMMVLPDFETLATPTICATKSGHFWQLSA